MEPFILLQAFIVECFILSLNSYPSYFGLYNYLDILEFVIIINSYIHNYLAFFNHMDYSKFHLIDLDYFPLNTYLIFDQCLEHYIC